MKVLIWIACLIGASTVEVFLGYVGIVGLIPTLAVYGGMFAAARYLCAKYEEERNGGSATDPVSSEEADGSSAAHGEGERENVESAFLPPITYCRKCGKKLVEDSDFCSFCGTAVVKE